MSYDNHPHPLQQIEDHAQRLVSETCQRFDDLSACLRKAWRNEKMAVMTAIIENRPMEESKVAEWHPLANVPADYYGNSRTYYGD